jgi:pyroglutamyl-peptidase
MKREMRAMKKPIVLLGFEPFGGYARNPSAELVMALAKRPEFADKVVAYVLPVSAKRVTPKLQEIIARHQPNDIVAFGLSSGEVIRIERVGVNLCDFRIPDADGAQPIDVPVIQGGPQAYFSTLPTRQLYEEIAAQNLPVELSLSAGAYLCNFLLYSLLHLAESGPHKFRTCFIHLPLLPEMTQTEPSMPFAQMTQAGQTILRCLL